MSEWKEYKLGEICSKIGSGATPKGGKEAYLGGDTSLIRSQNVLDFSFSWDGLAYINDEQATKLNGVEIEKGDVLLNITGDSVARACIVPQSALPARVNQHVSIIRGDATLVLNEYILYFLQYKKPNLLSLSKAGATRNALTKGMIEDFSISLPPLAKQARIVGVLSSLDDKIAVNKKICSNLEAQAQALFKHWFIDFAPFKDGKFVESELGLIPEGWRVGTFGKDVIEIKSGGTPKTDVAEYWENGTIPFFTPKDVSDTIYCFSTEKSITEAGLNKCNSQLYPQNTVFITARGTVGKVVLASCNMAMNQSNYALVGKAGYDQLYVLFQTRFLVERLKKKANGAVFSAITTTDFNERIVIPPFSAIADFVIVAKPLIDDIFNYGAESLRLSALRDTLLPKLMSGQIKL